MTRAVSTVRGAFVPILLVSGLVQVHLFGRREYCPVSVRVRRTDSILKLWVLWFRFIGTVAQAVAILHRLVVQCHSHVRVPEIWLGVPRNFRRVGHPRDFFFFRRFELFHRRILVAEWQWGIAVKLLRSLVPISAGVSLSDFILDFWLVQVLTMVVSWLSTLWPLGVWVFLNKHWTARDFLGSVEILGFLAVNIETRVGCDGVVVLEVVLQGIDVLRVLDRRIIVLFEYL